MELNERAKTTLIHISLNFHPLKNKRLSREFYMDVADKYMEKIWLRDQPHLIYQHLLAPLIREDDNRIAAHNIAKNLSEPARKEIEKEFGLIPADKKQRGGTAKAGTVHIPLKTTLAAEPSLEVLVMPFVEHWKLM